MSPTDPATLGKYQIRGMIGRGEMGTVYEGWDPQIDRRVAIKTVRLSESGDNEAAEAHSRFKREAQAAGRLTHPNIVGIYDYGETGDLAYIVMEYVEGDSLKAMLGRSERLPVNETVRLMEELLAGLQFSHDRGVVHRDIKPANVMITKEGRVKIADFGIARIESSSMTQAGTVMGTPAYMSPEQFMGQPVDKRTDIYSAGVLLYQLLTGERPFEGSVSGIMHKALNTTPPRPSEVSVTALPAFDAVVARAMSRRPDDRYPSASAFAAELRRAFDASASPRSHIGADDGTIVGAGRRVEQARPVARRAPAPIIAAAAAVLVIVGGAAWFLTRPSGPPPRVVVAERSPVAPPPAGQSVTPPAASAPDTGGAPASLAAARSADSAQALPTTPSSASQAPASPSAAPAVPAERVEPLVAPPAGQAASEQAQGTSNSPPPSVSPSVVPAVGARAATAAPIPPLMPSPNVSSTAPAASPPPASSPPIPPSPPSSSGAQAAAVTAPPPPPAPPAPATEPQQKTAMVMPNLASVGRALAQLAANSSCSLVQVGVTDGAEAVVSGLVGAGAPESTLRSAVHDAAPRGMTWQVRGINSTYCSTLDTLRPIYQRGSSMSVMLVGGQDRLRDGEAIRPVITMPDFPGHLQVDYLSHDGSISHLFPSSGAPDKLLAGGTKLLIGQGKSGVGTVGAPYGTDMIIAVASSVPLFPAGAPKDDNDTVDRYLPRLQAAIAAAEGKGAQVAGNAFALETVER